MALNVTGIFAQVTSHLKTLGVFSRVNGHEPKSAPTNGVTASVWVRSLQPYRERSGLAATSGLLVFEIRVQKGFLSEPQDGIDPDVLSAVDKLFAAYSGDIDLGGTVANIDLLGEAGTPMQVVAGYIDQDGKKFRVMTVALPLIINDIWGQST